MGTLRKIRKALWRYECPTCQTSAEGPDQWTPYEYQWHHERSAGHALNSLGKGIEILGEAFYTLAEGVATAMKPVSDLMYQLTAPAPNLPHDPSQRMDKRTWGGK